MTHSLFDTVSQFAMAQLVGYLLDPGTLFVIALAISVAFAHAVETERGKRGVAALGLALMGIPLGALGVLIAPEPLLRPLPIPGASLISVPAVLALAMEGVGKVRRVRGKGMSHVATWYGGGALGLGLAAGRMMSLTLSR